MSKTYLTQEKFLEMLKKELPTLEIFFVTLDKTARVLIFKDTDNYIIRSQEFRFSEEYTEDTISILVKQANENLKRKSILDIAKKFGLVSFKDIHEEIINFITTIYKKEPDLEVNYYYLPYSRKREVYKMAKESLSLRLEIFYYEYQFNNNEGLGLTPSWLERLLNFKKHRNFPISAIKSGLVDVNF